ncbi:MAG: hypothetical protein UX89_C0011G0004 [Parcubacteria group bacterium GW2011_GWA2_47_16]|nr:MAG: hypothetical protein UX89_C0011G0004 [Parcubacteria group bacterium GW2011_GWA2_47_16]
MFDTSDIEKIKEEGEKFYKNLGEIYCPYLKDKVSFNTQGLEHLKFKRRERARPVED